MKDDQTLALPTADEMLALAAAAMNKVSELRKASWTHKNKVAKLTDQDQIRNYDAATAHWPTT